MSEGAWVAIQRNPRSGSGKRRRALLELVQGLRSHGLRPRVFSRRDDLTKWMARPERRAALKCLVAAGGDGTVGDLLNRFPGVPLAVLPLGTENLLARYIGVTRCGHRLAEVIAAGKTRTLDVCQLGDRRFLLVASAGFDADVIHCLEARRKGNISHLSYLPAIWDAVRRFQYPELKVFVDDVEIPLSGRMALVFNLPMYAFRLPVACCANGEDGQLDLRLFQRPRLTQLVRYCYHILCRRHETLKDVQVRTGRRIRIESAAPVPIQVDGDSAGFTPAEITVLPGALTLIVP